MIKAYIVGVAVAAVVLIISALSLLPKAGKKNMLFSSLVQMFCIASIACVAYLCAIVARTPMGANWAYCIYYISIDWILASLFFYSRIYTKVWNGKTIVPVAYCGIALLDNISLMVNYKYNHAYSMEWVVIREGEGIFIPKINDYYYVHLTICYIIILVIIAMFVTKIVKTGGHQRGRYITVLAMVMGVIIINAIVLTLHFTIDISVCFYSIAAIAIGYFSKNVNSQTLTENMLATIAERIECALVAFDENDNCIYFNQLASRIFGLNDTRTIIEENFRQFRDGRETNAIQNCNWNDIYQINGEECRFDIHFTKIYDKKGRYVGAYISYYDVTSDYIAYEEEKYRSTHDNLTGAPNRECFFEQVRTLLDEYPTTDYLMICSDIKGFKLVNDMFGLDVADDVLKKIAEVIRARITETATYARLEADRFALFMPKEHYSEELLRSGLSEIEYVINNSQYRMNILVGVYDIYDRNASVASMCDRAFLAIDSIKDSFNTGIAYYGDMLRNAYMNEQKIIGEFENALAAGQFAMFLQPIVDRGGVVKFSEALVRWIHPERGIIQPGGFVPVLEDTGYIYKLDLYIWEQACRRIAYWNAMGHDDMSISVNISVKDFYYIDIYDTVVSLVERYHIKPSQLKLEITESVFMVEKERLIDIIYALRDYGFTIEIDDFGSGFSSLNMLKEVPSNVLKIDMNFLSTSEHDDRGKKIIDTIINLAQTLEMLVIVEGVENEEQVIYLRESGADFFQGYFFDKPLPVKTFEEKYLIQ